MTSSEARHEKMNDVITESIEAYPHGSKDAEVVMSEYEISDMQQAAYVRGAYEAFDLTPEQWDDKAEKIARTLNPSEWEVYDDLAMRTEEGEQGLSTSMVKAVRSSVRQAEKTMKATGYQKVR